MTSAKLVRAKSVVLGHPDAVIAEGIAAILQKASFSVRGIANTKPALGELVLQHKPDIILFEPAICQQCLDTIGAFRQQSSDSAIVLMTKEGVLDGITAAIQAGASGCISVDVTPEEFIRSLELLSLGGLVVSENMATGVRKELALKQKTRPIETLSDRERQILRHIGKGSTNREIAGELFISEHTVKVHVRSVLNKLNLKNRQQAAVIAAEEGLISHPDSKSNEQSTQ